MSKYKMVVVVLVGSVFMFLEARADVFMKYKIHTDGYQVMGMSQPAKDELHATWIAKNKMRSDGGKTSVIVLQDKKKIYIVNHETKTFGELPIDVASALEEKMNNSSASTEQKKQMQEMMKKMSKVTVTVTPTGEAKKIGKWKCKKYLKTMNMMVGVTESEVWTTEEIKMDYKKYLDNAESMFKPGSMLGSLTQGIADASKKLTGFPVLTVSKMKMMGASINSRNELIEFREGKAPSGHFELPKGYTKQTGVMQQGGMSLPR